jgi:hypothetical protein
VTFPPSLREITKRADVAFFGHVVSLSQEDRADIAMAFTHVTFAIDQPLFDRKRPGRAEAPSLTA